MKKKKKNIYNLKLICDGAMPEFVVDEETIELIEKQFEGDDVISFTDLDDNGEVKVRNRKLIGYKKAAKDLIPSDLKKNIELAGIKKIKKA